MTKEHLGPANDAFIWGHGFTTFTQVRVWEGDVGASQPLAHFIGPMAKINASRFINMTTESSK